MTSHNDIRDCLGAWHYETPPVWTETGSSFNEFVRHSPIRIELSCRTDIVLLVVIMSRTASFWHPFFALVSNDNANPDTKTVDGAYFLGYFVSPLPFRQSQGSTGSSRYPHRSHFYHPNKSTLFPSNDSHFVLVDRSYYLRVKMWQQLGTWNWNR